MRCRLQAHLYLKISKCHTCTGPWMQPKSGDMWLVIQNRGEGADKPAGTLSESSRNRAGILTFWNVAVTTDGKLSSFLYRPTQRDLGRDNMGRLHDFPAVGLVMTHGVRKTMLSLSCEPWWHRWELHFFFLIHFPFKLVNGKNRSQMYFDITPCKLQKQACMINKYN